MKRLFLTAIVIMSVLFPVAEAKKRPTDIHVTAPATVQLWAAQLSRRINDAMRYPVAMSPTERLYGFAHVRFTMNADGSLRSVWFCRKSGNRQIDQAALNAASKLNGLASLPAGIASGRQIEAQLFFAEDEEEMRDMVRANTRVRDLPADALAERTDPPLVLASLARMPGS
ncbi:energy transducer TonB family protein [Sphingomonas sp. CV7422]|uniref:energy transducer TonB family protein n=1 Tax=Sphingomonas sp. CV7422 TaxID=3018036 RepID=UPI0022FF05B2|nr:TonB family protein [Sphingomonas sp. CV7422]